MILDKHFPSDPRALEPLQHIYHEGSEIRFTEFLKGGKARSQLHDMIEDHVPTISRKPSDLRTQVSESNRPGFGIS
jgi:hypothetical protein